MGMACGVPRRDADRAVWSPDPPQSSGNVRRAVEIQGRTTVNGRPSASPRCGPCSGDASGSIATYIMDYMTTFATVTLHMRADVAFGTTVIVGLTDCCLAPVGGWLSDRYGRKPAMMIPWILLFLVVVPAFT